MVIGVPGGQKGLVNCKTVNNRQLGKLNHHPALSILKIYRNLKPFWDSTTATDFSKHSFCS